MSRYRLGSPSSRAAIPDRVSPRRTVTVCGRSRSDAVGDAEPHAGVQQVRLAVELVGVEAGEFAVAAAVAQVALRQTPQRVARPDEMSPGPPHDSRMRPQVGVRLISHCRPVQRWLSLGAVSGAAAAGGVAAGPAEDARDAVANSNAAAATS